MMIQIGRWAVDLLEFYEELWIYLLNLIWIHFEFCAKFAHVLQTSKVRRKKIGVFTLKRIKFNSWFLYADSFPSCICRQVRRLETRLRFRSGIKRFKLIPDLVLKRFFLLFLVISLRHSFQTIIELKNFFNVYSLTIKLLEHTHFARGTTFFWLKYQRCVFVIPSFCIPMLIESNENADDAITTVRVDFCISINFRYLGPSSWNCAAVSVLHIILAMEAERKRWIF